MNYQEYETKFRSKAISTGYSEEEIQKCLNYAKRLLDNNLPVIYNSSNLSALLGYKKSYLKRAAIFTNFFYREFSIKKKNGRLRKISEPLPSLKEIQIWILKNILYRIPVSKYAKAYIPGRGILDNVKYHKNKVTVLTLDIKDFFSSIKRESIESIFRDCGYSSNISNLLSKICTNDGILPQGAPTSAYLSNLYLRNFDDAVSIYCKDISVRYTRYADDLVFSGDFDVNKLQSFVSSELLKNGLILNTEKVRVMSQNERQIVTGIIVNNTIQLPKNERKKIRQEIFYIKKYGLDEHLMKINNTRNNYLYHLMGKINFALYVNPKDKEMQMCSEYMRKTFFKVVN